MKKYLLITLFLIFGLISTSAQNGKTESNNNSKKITYELNQNYPNPFNPSTIIKYSIPQAGFVTLKIYNLLGQEIKTLVSEFQEAGSYSINFKS